MVDIAAKGSLAQGLLEEKEYDLVLIDIRTPVMNGKQLYQSILEGYPEVVSGGHIYRRGSSQRRYE